MMPKNHETKVRIWLVMRLTVFIMQEVSDDTNFWQIISRMRAIIKEAELRLKHPNFPETNE